ncbi:MAG: hypothetical protein ACK55I_45685, partial [bacterium]
LEPVPEGLNLPTAILALLLSRDFFQSLTLDGSGVFICKDLCLKGYKLKISLHSVVLNPVWCFLPFM